MPQENSDGLETVDTVAKMIIVAHQDDDTLFMHRDLRNQLDSGGAMTTVFVTAGDAGLDETYWLGREAGARAAYSEMTGAETWVNETVSLEIVGQSYQIASSWLVDRPEVRLYFLRLPDGPGGRGTAAQGFQSLEKLWMDDIATVSSVDGAAMMTRVDVLNVLLALMLEHQPGTLMIPDVFSRYAAGEHSDHRHTARFAMLAHQLYDTDHEIEAFVGYSTRMLPANVSGAELERAVDVFSRYALHDNLTVTGYNQDGTPAILGNYLQYLQRQYSVDDLTSYWLNGMAENAGNWRVGTHVRLFADVDGDGRADAVGFGTANVQVAGNNSIGFNEARNWSAEFTQRAGWNVNRHERLLADVNGDGRADIVGFGDQGVMVALSNGGGFDAATLWVADYGRLAGNWRVHTHERLMGDVNGDGLADVVGFGAAGVRVSLSTGTEMTRSTLWTTETLFAARNIDPTRHERAVADVNGDGLADAVLFADHGVMVALSNGSGFDAARLWIANFAQEAGNWRVGTHERFLADVNGDGRADVVGFGHAGVLVALSTGDGFGQVRRWTTEDDFRVANWDSTRHVREVADMNGDGMADLVWIDDHGIRVSLSTGSSFVTPAYNELISDAFLF
ncbi:FG-GAP-like repeat-containing protein [Paracoccus sp. DMF-8]|uniref:FG-GAP-like repeat-containing protein n=1 Tax=Paracoccus sp. DMF-8 TaxID=3019445 RepID=UPI0023E7DDE3|nr:FG-GAP-like repeat-containing protein [Paracoccus sp. DMF-8]MDF3604901.1 FG-GAP-like repeat-containing protein [Paracoccus sp. DMF-8]